MYISPENVILQDKEQSVIIPSIVFPALHIFDIKMPYCGVIVPNSTTYTHTVACAMMIILRGKEALSRRNDAIY